MSGPSTTSQGVRVRPNDLNVTTRGGRQTTSAVRPEEPKPSQSDPLPAAPVPPQATAVLEALGNSGRLQEKLQRNKKEKEEKLAHYRALCELIKRDYEQLNYKDQQLRLFRERVRATHEQLEKDEAEIEQRREYVEAQRRKKSIE